MTPQERAEFDDLREMVDVLMTEVFGTPEEVAATLTRTRSPDSDDGPAVDEPSTAPLGLGEARRRLFEKVKERKR